MDKAGVICYIGVDGGKPRKGLATDRKVRFPPSLILEKGRYGTSADMHA